MTTKEAIQIAIVKNVAEAGIKPPLSNKSNHRKRKKTAEIEIDPVFCSKSYCDKELIKTKAGNHYWIWHRPRQCDRCSKYLWSNDELFTCENYHFFGSDTCVPCNESLRKQKVISENKAVCKEAVILCDDRPKDVELPIVIPLSPTLLSEAIQPQKEELNEIAIEQALNQPQKKEIIKEIAIEKALEPMKDSSNFPYCGRKNCDKQLIKTVCKDFYYMFNRWRECEVCRKTLRGNDEMWLCPAGHFVNYDLCIECEEYPDQAEKVKKVKKIVTVSGEANV